MLVANRKTLTTARSASFFFTALLASCFVLGQDLKLSSTLTPIAEKVPADFKGAVFICSPYCELLSLRLKEEWVPPLPAPPLSSSHLYLMSKEDPLFLALFPEKAEEAKATTEAVESTEKEKPLEKANDNSATESPQQKENLTKVPKTAFNDAVRLSPALRYTTINQSSNSTVQSNFSPHAGLFNLSLGLGYFHAKPTLFLSKYWQLEAGYELDLFGSSAKVASSSLKENQNELYFIPWIREKTFSWGPRLSLLNENLKVATDTLPAYSYSESSTLLGVAYKHKRFSFFADYAIGLKITEQQPFRSGLHNSSLYRLTLNYCQSLKTWSGLRLVPCYDLSYLQSQSSASLAPELDPSQTSNIKRQEVAFKFILHYGEDFLR